MDVIKQEMIKQNKLLLLTSLVVTCEGKFLTMSQWQSWLEAPMDGPLLKAITITICDCMQRASSHASSSVFINFLSFADCTRLGSHIVY